MARKTRRPSAEYATELPEGVGLRYAAQFARYQLYSLEQGVLLKEIRVSEVLKWKEPARVFGHIARRILRKS